MWQQQFVPILKLSVATTVCSNIEASVTQAFLPGILQTVEDIRPGNKLLWRTKHWIISIGLGPNNAIFCLKVPLQKKLQKPYPKVWNLWKTFENPPPLV